MEPVRCNQEAPPRNNLAKAFRLASLGWELVFTVGLAVAAGVWLSRRTGSQIPLLAIPLAGLILGMVRFLISVLRLLK